MRYTRSALLIAIGPAFQLANTEAQTTQGQVHLTATALAVVDSQVDFLSTKGATWKLVGKSVEAKHAVENLEVLFKVSKANDVSIFVCPHYYYPWDHKREPSGGAGEEMLRSLKPFECKGPLTLQGFESSAADWMPQYEQFINHGDCEPAQTLRARGERLGSTAPEAACDKGDPPGMSANLCIESHMRYLLEQGFEIAVVKDATAAFQLPGLDGYAAALTNFQMIANAVMTAEEVIRAFNGFGARK